MASAATLCARAAPHCPNDPPTPPPSFFIRCDGSIEQNENIVKLIRAAIGFFGRLSGGRLGDLLRTVADSNDGDRMPGKHIQLDDDTWHALDLLARDRMMDFQELADEAFRDLLRKHGRPATLKAALRQSLGEGASVHTLPSKTKDKKKRPVRPSTRGPSGRGSG